MSAPRHFVDWLTQYSFVDRNCRLPPGLRLNIHSRSDAHSKQLGRLIIQDLIATCDVLRDHAARGEIVCGINYRYRWPNGKVKTLDLAIGVPADTLDPPTDSLIYEVKATKIPMRYLLIACEEKTVLTEHGKSQPRIYSELNDAHTIIHQGNRASIAAGIATINIAQRFVSPLRQRPSDPIVITQHDQPHVTQSMVEHLRQLPIRESVDAVGFDAYCSFVIDVDNLGRVGLWDESPAPQVGEADHYETFLQRICRLYAERFSDLGNLPEPSGLSVEEALTAIAAQHPGTLETTGTLAVDAQLGGAEELKAILDTIEHHAIPRPRASE